MKAKHRTAPTTACRASRSKRLAALLCIAFLFAGFPLLRAQDIPESRFTDGEQIRLQLYFKWGVLMPKAGNAELSVRSAESGGTPVWNYRLLFRTAGIFEKIFPMRDTLDCLFSRPGTRLLAATKRSDEGHHYSIDELSFEYGDSVRVRSRRRTLQATRIDTVLTAPAPLFDMLAATMYLRSIDWSPLNLGDTLPFRIAIGRDVVRAAYRYTGQQVVERHGIRFRTRHFFIDVYDEAFTQSRAAGEAWIGDDRNHIPVRVRAKWKIGAAEVYYNGATGLPFPLECAVEK